MIDAMYEVSLRVIDGSAMMIIPYALLDFTESQKWRKRQSCYGRRPAHNPVMPTCYTAEELLAECDPGVPITNEEREWLDAPCVGRELI